MIAFSNFYNFPAEEVEYLQVSENTTGDYRFVLTVCLKSGNKCTVSYGDSRSRDAAKCDLLRQIEKEKQADAEKIISTLTLLRYTIERIDKRQLRIWRQLKALLGVKTEGDDA